MLETCKICISKNKDTAEVRPTKAKVESLSETEQRSSKTNASSAECAERDNYILDISEGFIVKRHATHHCT